MIIDKIGRSKFIQRIIKKTEDKNIYEKLNHRLPLIEGGLTTLAYISVTQLNKKIPTERKPSMVWQSLIGGVAGILISKKLDDAAKKHTNRLCIEMDKLDLPKPKNTISGVRILAPILITTLILRYGVSVVSVGMSTKIVKLQNKYNKKE